MKYIKLDLKEMLEFKHRKLNETDYIIFKYIEIIKTKYNNKNISFAQIAKDLGVSKATVSRSIYKILSHYPEKLADGYEFLLLRLYHCNKNETARNDNISNVITIDNVVTETRNDVNSLQNETAELHRCNESVAQMQHQSCVDATARNDNNNTQCHYDNYNNNDKNKSKIKSKIDIDIDITKVREYSKDRDIKLSLDLNKNKYKERKERKYIKERKERNFISDFIHSDFTQDLQITNVTLPEYIEIQKPTINQDINKNNYISKSDFINKEVTMERKFTNQLTLSFEEFRAVLKANGCSILPASINDIQKIKSFYQSFIYPPDDPDAISYITCIDNTSNVIHITLKHTKPRDNHVGIQKCL